MSIQGSLNQAAGIGAALYTQTPSYAAKKEEKLKQTELKTSKAQLEALKPELEKEFDVPKEGDKEGSNRYITGRLAQDIMEEKADVLRQRIFDLNPNAATAGDLYGNKKFGELSQNPRYKRISEELIARQEAARQTADDIKQARTYQNQTILTNVNKWGETNGK